jgi:molybdopterin-guanine dinucleotide biosynthesis protein A
MDAKPRVAGIVIAAGRSTRFGGEKAVARFRGEPLLLRAAWRLATAAEVVAVNARPGSGAEALARGSGYPILHDAPGDPDGPLSGVKAGLAWARARGAQLLAVSPCDLPLLPEDTYRKLVAAAGGGAAMAETPQGYQPLVAVWPVAALEALAAELAGGAHPPTWRVLQSLGAVRVRFESPACFANVNTREELARLEATAAADHQR